MRCVMHACSGQGFVDGALYGVCELSGVHVVCPCVADGEVENVFAVTAHTHRVVRAIFLRNGSKNAGERNGGGIVSLGIETHRHTDT